MREKEREKESEREEERRSRVEKGFFERINASFLLLLLLIYLQPRQWQQLRPLGGASLLVLASAVPGRGAGFFVF